MPFQLFPTVISILLMLTSLNGVFGTTAEITANPLPANGNDVLCGAYYLDDDHIMIRAANQHWQCISLDNIAITTTEVFLHELGHAVDAKCMSKSERGQYKHMLGLNMPWQHPHYQSPSEQFANAFAQAITEADVFSSSHTQYEQDLTLYYWMRCTDVFEVVKVYRAHNAVLNSNPSGAALVYWTARVAESDKTVHEVVGDLMDSNGSAYVANMTDWQFVHHIFNSIVLRNPTWHNGETQHWLAHVRNVGRQQAISDLLLNV